MPSKSSGRLTALTAPRLSHGRAVVLLCRLAVGLSLPALAGTAFAGSVRGRIAGQEKLIPDVYVEASKSDAHRWTWREPSPTVKAEFHVLSGNPSRDLCIAAIAGANANPHDPVLVRVTGGHTIPTTIVVSPGTRLSFENRDPFPHRLYQATPANSGWKADVLDSARRREWTAPPGAGRFEFRDELFPSVRTFVVVDPQVVDIAYPGHDGGFVMNLANGDYTLKAYFNGKQVGRPVSVSITKDKPQDLKEPLNVGETADGKPL
jgi:hypothetical protein